MHSILSLKLLYPLLLDFLLSIDAGMILSALGFPSFFFFLFFHLSSVFCEEYGLDYGEGSRLQGR